MTAINPEFLYPEAAALPPMMFGKKFTRGMKAAAGMALAGILSTSAPGLAELASDNIPRAEYGSVPTEPTVVNSSMPYNKATPEMLDTVMQLSTGEAIIVAGGVGFLLWKAGMVEIPGYDELTESLSNHGDEESLTVNVINSEAFRTNIHTVLTVTSSMAVEVRKNEAGIFDWVPGVEDSWNVARQKVDLFALGDVDISIDGPVEIRRDNQDPNLVHIYISSFRTWRPRVLMESLVFNPEGDESDGFPGDLRAGTRDSATRVGLLALQVLASNEGCSLAAQELIRQEVLLPAFKNLLENSEVWQSIKMEPGKYDIEWHFSMPEEPPLASIEDFARFYTEESTYERIINNEPLSPPQLGDVEAIELLKIIVEEEGIDSFSLVDGNGESVSLDELIERGKVCGRNVLGDIVNFKIHQVEPAMFGEPEDFVKDNVPIG